MARDPFERLTALLATAPGVADWKLRRRSDRETQLYLVGARQEALRTVAGDRYDVTVYVDHDGKRGSSSATVLPEYPDEWAARVRDAVFRAKLQSNPPFTLPGRSRYRTVTLVDAAIRDRPDEAARAVADRLLRLVRREAGVRLSSAEVFLTHARTRFANSRGASGEYDETSAELEFVILAGDGVRGTEALAEYGRRRVSDLAVEESVADAARHARDALVAAPPRGAKSAAVIFSGEPLRDGTISDFWQPFRFHLSAEAAYRKLSRFAPGRSITSGRLAGEPLRLAADPTLRYGVASAPFDRDGVALRRVSLVDAGKLERYWATKEYADYLGVEPTGMLTNIDVLPGRAAAADLSRDGAALEVVSFSWFNPDVVTGDFSCEIRLGYEHRRGSVRPVKGGAVQGNLFTAFAHARFSREVEWMGTYHGPRAIRFEGLTVAGS